MSQKIAEMYARLYAKDELTPALSNAKTGLAGFNTSLLKGVGGLVGITSAAAVAGLAFRGMKVSLEAAAEAEKGMARLNATLQATGRESEITSGQIDKMAGSLMKTSTFDDEAIIDAYNALAKFNSVPTEGMESIVKTAMDMTAALGGDLAGNAESIGKLLESGLIPRTWGFSEALKENIKAQIAAGDSAGALNTIMAELNKRFGGQAAAQLDTYSGATTKLGIAWSELAETLGNTFMPKITPFVQGLTALLTVLQEGGLDTKTFDEAAQNAAKALTDVGLATDTATENAKQWAEYLQRRATPAIEGNTQAVEDYSWAVMDGVPSLQNMAAAELQLQLAQDGTFTSEDAQKVADFKREIGLLSDAEYEATIKAIALKTAIDGLKDKHITITAEFLGYAAAGLSIPESIHQANQDINKARSYTGRAGGGPLAPGQWAEVGEQGAEGITPQGVVIPHQQWEMMKRMGLVPARRYIEGGDIGGGSNITLSNQTTAKKLNISQQSYIYSVMASPFYQQMISSGQDAFRPSGGGATQTAPQSSVIQQAVTAAVTASAQMTQQAAMPVASAAIKISESGERTAQATQLQTAQNNAGNAAILARLQSIENLLDRNFQRMPKDWAAAAARNIPV